MMYSLTVATPPATEPVSLTELAQHLHLNTHDEDQQLPQFICAARQQFEFLTEGRTVLPTTFRLNLTDWCHPTSLPVGNVSEVTSVSYYDEEDQPQELDGFLTDLTGCPSLVWLADLDYPALSPKRFRPITVEFVAGWASVSSVPADVKLAIKQLAAHYFNVREAFGEVDYKEVPVGFTHFCSKYKTGLGGF